MSRVIIKRSLIVITGLFIGGGFLTACGGGGEESQLVRAFFQASRFNDRSTVGNMSMVFFPPEDEGIASSPSIDGMQEEQRVPLRMQELGEALVDARQAEEDFREEKKMYQDENEEKMTIGYCRVSSHDQKEDLERQIKRVEKYCHKFECPVEIIRDLGSGLNFKKRGLQRLIQLILKRKISKLVLTHRDRLLRFGSELILALCKFFSVEVFVMEEKKSKSEEDRYRSYI